MITICLATFNGEKYLGAQLDSLFSQTFKDWTLLIHDDNSTDNTVQIIYEYIAKFPNKIKFIDDALSYDSSSSNFNSLLKQASSEYVMFCDQDDVWREDKIELTLLEMQKLQKLHKNEALMVFSNLSVVDENCNMIAKSMWAFQKLNPSIIYNLYDILALNVVSGCTIMINKNAQDIVSPFPKNCIEHDHWMAVNIVKYGYASFVNEPLMFYRQHEKNVIGSYDINIGYFMHKIKSLMLFKCKYSKFDFKINLVRVFLKKLLLNFKRIL